MAIGRSVNPTKTWCTTVQHTNTLVMDSSKQQRPNHAQASYTVAQEALLQAAEVVAPKTQRELEKRGCDGVKLKRARVKKQAQRDDVDVFDSWRGL